MKKIVCTLIAAASIIGASASVGYAAAPKPSGYCKKAEVGKTAKYTTPSTHVTKTLKCTRVYTQRWVTIK